MDRARRGGLTAAAFYALGACAVMSASPGLAASPNAPFALSAVPDFAAPDGFSPRLLDISINGQGGYGTALLMGIEHAGEVDLYATAAVLRGWRIRRPEGGAEKIHQGQTYYRLRDIAGLHYRVDRETSSLHLRVPAHAFTGTTVVGIRSPGSAAPDPISPGGFLNYDLVYTRDAEHNLLGNAWEAGVFTNHGVGVSQFLATDITGADRRWLRTQTSWTYKASDSMTSLHLLDSVTRGGPMNGSVLIGGVQFGSDFTTRPYLPTYPLPALAGETATASTLQLYVNGHIEKTAQIPPGHFSVPDVPVVSGPGEIRMVVQDALGRRQIMTTSFYADSSLLTPGLADYSVSFGALREHYGFESNDYGPLVATGLFRYGFNRHLTGGVYADVSRRNRDLSLSATYATLPLGSVNAGVAVSDSELGVGGAAQLGWSRQWRYFSASVDARLSSADHTLLGYDGERTPERLVMASAGARLGRFGSVSLSWLDQRYTANSYTRLLRFNYGTSIGFGYVNVDLYRTLDEDADSGIVVTLNIPFGQQSNASVGVTRDGGETRSYVRAQRSRPIGTGMGYLVGQEFGQNAASTAQLSYQNGAGIWGVGATRTEDATRYQAQASGGVAFAGGRLFLSRPIQDAFGVVEVPGLADVVVYSNHQPVAVTDRQGFALIPHLHAYQSNALSIRPEELPLSVGVSRARLTAVPSYRSAAVVRFPVSNTQGATLSIVQMDGEAVPAGASVRLVGSGQSFPVGLDGQAYVSGLLAHNVMAVEWPGHRCRITVEMPGPVADPLPELGEFVCREGAR